MRTPFLTKCENTLALYRRSSTEDIERSRASYAGLWGENTPSSQLVVLLADIELERRQTAQDC